MWDLKKRLSYLFIRSNWDNEDADNARSRQESQAEPGAACSRQESSGWKGFVLNFFFSYTKSFFLFFLLNSFDFIILNRQIFFFKCKHIQFQLSLDMFIYMYLCTPNFGVRSTKVGQHNILLLTCMHIYRMHCIMHVCRNIWYLYDQYITSDI